ncbi:hypothetical protein H2198_008893 [Neophaeococcomyces mojaviensis]|uniref:Uncharacterized protein n=1 Tax=Neophaeococcomyces mojaviensis TaxID=3383035 RepID=A0ACC2ZW88_9EURO|nr:hypothetical protein H2198_008893 [Knufia sp. JES_112]
MPGAGSDVSEKRIPLTAERAKENIAYELDEIDESGSFAYASEIKPAPNPGLTVEGIGDIGLPLTQRDAEALISKCRLSPFGRGSETVVDTNVRNSFELNPSQFAFRNPAWSASIDAIVGIVYAELGLTCGRQNVIAELYKLLLYEEGAFFKSHQDSEKTRGMFGTLVVCLPSEHQGGAVLLKHNKHEYTFDSSKTSSFGTSFAAWYSDVFHEVQRVTGGRRLALTYNLVQKAVSTPQKAPDGDKDIRLTNVLQAYNKAVNMAKNDSFPPYLIYRLEHKYSRHGLTIKGLKGDDEKRIKRLNAVCEKIGFDIYLGSVKKTLHRDDDCDDEVFDRDEGFEYINGIDGTAIDVKPTYSKRYVINTDGYETEDEEADEEEHAGYTGNEGCPAEYIYRDSVALIVPPSRRVDLLVSEQGDNYTKIMKVLDSFTSQNLEKGSYNYDQFVRLLEIVVARQDNYHRSYYWYSSYWADIEKQKRQKRECLEKIAKIAADWDLPDVWEDIKAEFRLAPKCLEAFGGFLARNKAVDEWDKALQELLESSPRIDSRLEGLESINTGLHNEEASVDVACAFSLFTLRMLKKWLSEFSSVRQTDGKALADVLWKHSHEHPDIEKAIMEKIQESHTTVLVAFLIQWAEYSTGETLTDRVRQPLQSTMKLLWNSFEFELPVYPKLTSRDFGNRDPAPTERDVLTSEDLIRVLDVANRAEIDNFDAFGLLTVMQIALQNVSSAYAKEHLLPLLSQIVKRAVPALETVQNSTSTVPEEVKAFLIEGLTTVIKKHIGPKPVRSTNLSLPRGSCNCSDCSQVNSFLASSTKKQFDFPCSKKRRAHLHSMFTDRANGKYEVETLRNSSPNVWRITKTFDKIYKTRLQEWTSRVNGLKEELGKLTSVRGGPLNEEALGSDVYERLMSCTVEGLEERKGRKPLGKANANAKKRKADDVGKEENQDRAGVKKTRSGLNFAGGREIIDLT